MNNNHTTIHPTCRCCFPAQMLVTTGQRAFCPLTERIYDNVANDNQLRPPTVTATNYDQKNNQAENQAGANPIVDFYPGNARRRGEVAAFAINPAEDRFGA